MQTYAIPAWIWLNLALLVAAAVYVGLRIAAEEKGRRGTSDAGRPPAGLGRALH